jgi:hypothetical protein
MGCGCGCKQQATMGCHGCAGSSPYAGLGAAHFSAKAPLQSGDAGIAQTVQFMQQLIDQGVTDPYVNRFTIDALRNFGVDGFDDGAKARVLFDILRPGGYGGFVYVPNPESPLGQRETVRSAATFLEVGGGDCKNFTVAFSALMGTVGIPTRIVTVASDPRAPDEFSHVYPEVEINGAWIPMDAARPDAAFGKAPQRVYRKKIWPSEISGSSDAAESFSGVAHSLAGYHRLVDGPARLAGLGQSANDIAQDITASAAGAADIILASNASPYNIYGTVSTLPGTGGLAVAPYAGYPSSAVALGTISPTTLLLIGGAFLMIMMMARK